MRYSNCKVSPPAGLPALESHELPEDIRLFYERCGGLRLFEDKDHSCQIVSPSEFVLSNPVIVGELVEEDISSHWYIIGNDGNGDYISIDLHPDRLVQINGERWYWLREDFESLGDAYDDVEMTSD
jgi:hypothetical protein